MPVNMKRKKASRCLHVQKIDSISHQLIQLKAKSTYCVECRHKDKREDTWLCLHCLTARCGEDTSDHSGTHAKVSQHPLVVNLHSLRFWCFDCNEEVYEGESNTPAFIIPEHHELTLHNSLSLFELGAGDGEQSPTPLGLVGLRNLGNTCYMNSALQCLSNCQALTRLFLDCSALTDVGSRAKDVSEAYLKLLSDIWSSSRPGVVYPSEILHAIQYINPSFRGGHQQDSQEFLRCLIDQLHEELKKPIPVDQSQGQSDLQKGGTSQRTAKFHSVIGDLFNGLIKSSVRCLTCDKVSVTEETFQDLSLPIPSGDQLCRQRQQLSTITPGSSLSYSSSSLLSWVWNRVGSIVSWTTGWIWGPDTTLDDCLAGFFSADELTGDNMYSCENCKKLRNGVKEVSILQLPEIVCIHLKRFRHEFLNSCKIGSYVAYPLENLDLTPYLDKDSGPAANTLYDLTGVICHYGSVGGGHYIAYARNPQSLDWYEFDDQCVTKVAAETVRSSQAYVLFYTRNSSKQAAVRRRILKEFRLARKEHGLLQFFISKPWLIKFLNCADPGPISNAADFLCCHDAVRPPEFACIDQLVVAVPEAVWSQLYHLYGGGPTVNCLQCCETCKEVLTRLQERRAHELSQYEQRTSRRSRHLYAISTFWFRSWERFIKEQTDQLPGPIDNRGICFVDPKRPDVVTLRRHSEYCQVPRRIWLFLHQIYGGGPAILLTKSEDPAVIDSDSEGQMTQPTLSADSEPSGSNLDISTSHSESFISLRDSLPHPTAMRLSRSEGNIVAATTSASLTASENYVHRSPLSRNQSESTGDTLSIQSKLDAEDTDSAFQSTSCDLTDTRSSSTTVDVEDTVHLAVQQR